ncbi:MAG: nucleotidyltransferase domain-containing protein [Desulfuromonas thiophila]|jgi:predicted nucleotidyltransferase|nr:nucleotidyltransferase domain-containing protein [Desulfuromonas thiophila]
MMHDSRRVYGQVKILPFPILQQAFAPLSYVRIALLFGSRAGANATPQSDYDFAVWIDKTQPFAWGALAQLRIELGAILNLPDEDFDLIDLEIATPEMVESIALQYRILKGDERVVRSLLAKHHKNC